jgi:methyltransferase-like protein
VNPTATRTYEKAEGESTEFVFAQLPQDFKENLKSELMLEELRKRRERDKQMDHLNNALAALQNSLPPKNM